MKRDDQHLELLLLPDCSILLQYQPQDGSEDLGGFPACPKWFLVCLFYGISFLVTLLASSVRAVIELGMVMLLHSGCRSKGVCRLYQCN